MEKVSISKCASYNEDEVLAGLKEVLDRIGGLNSYVSANETVVIKANLLRKATPEQAVTTHFEVVKALAKMLVEIGAKVIIADSPGGLYNKSALNAIYRISKMDEAASKSGASLNYNFDSQVVDLKGAVTKNCEITDVVLKADKVINLCKLKTHSLTRYTGAVKNLFGCIPGLTKVQSHGKNSDLFKFTDHLIDIERFLKDKVVLHIMDAVVGMEGAGPAGGTPRSIDRIMASTNAYALDFAACTIIGENIIELAEFSKAKERGVFDCTAGVEVLGESLEGSKVKGYKLIQSGKSHIFLQKFLNKKNIKAVAEYPTVRRSKCKGCKKCAEHCPVNAISIDKVATFDYDKCIRCYCCQELCPFNVITIKKPLLAKLLSKF